jgi:hypothetical protein
MFAAELSLLVPALFGSPLSIRIDNRAYTDQRLAQSLLESETNTSDSALRLYPLDFPGTLPFSLFVCHLHAPLPSHLMSQKQSRAMEEYKESLRRYHWTCQGTNACKMT